MAKTMFQQYFRNLYLRTMREAYSLAHTEIVHSLQKGGKCLDCGASTGYKFDALKEIMPIRRSCYFGIEWDRDSALIAQKNNFNVVIGDLNKQLQFTNDEFKCVFGLSVLEHLINPCHYLKECYRVLEKNGCLIILTPNISTYFTAILILLGKMPSSGPHPDSNQLVKHESLFITCDEGFQPNTESDTPTHRHMIVFSYRVLMSYLRTLGFKKIRGYGFGLYPFPNFLQPILEKIDAYHCHQMVIVAHK